MESQLKNQRKNFAETQTSLSEIAKVNQRHVKSWANTQTTENIRIEAKRQKS